MFGTKIQLLVSLIMFMSLAEGAFARITVPDKIEKGKISLTRANTDLDTSIAEWKIVCTSLVTNEIVPRQRIEMEIESNASLDSCSVEVWIRDELLSTNNIGTIKKGKSAIELLLPERSDTVLTRWVLLSGVNKVTETTVEWTAPRHWTIYVLKSTHMDIGLHHPPYIQRFESGEFIDQVKEMADEQKNRPDPSRFRFFIEGMWWWFNYPMDHSKQKANEIASNYIKPATFGVGASHAGNNTHVYGDEQMARSTYLLQRFKSNWGVRPSAMVMTDMNGMSWSLVSAYADAGIKYMGFFPNDWNPPTIGGVKIDTDYDSKLPHLFYWQGIDGKSKMLVWSNPVYVWAGKPFGLQTSTGRRPFWVEPDTIAPMMADQLRLLEQRYPYDVWLVSNYDDNDFTKPNPVFSNVAHAWNKRWKWPQLRTVGDLSEPFKKVEEKFADQIPTLKGTITAGWAQEPLSTPELLSKKKEADRTLPLAEKWATVARLSDSNYRYPRKQIERGWQALLSNDEHSYGISNYSGRKVYDTWMQRRDWIDKALRTANFEKETALKAVASQVAVRGRAAIVFNSTLKSRTDWVTIELPDSLSEINSLRYVDGTEGRVYKIKGGIRFLAKDVPPMGYARFELIYGTPELPITKKLIHPPVVDNKFYRIAFDSGGAISSIYDKELSKELIDQNAEYGFNQFVYTKDGHQTFTAPAVETFEVVRSAGLETVIVHLTDTATGSKIIQSISIYDDDKRIDIQNTFTHVNNLADVKKRYLRYGYYAFPFEIEKGNFYIDVNPGVADAYRDQTELTTNTYHAVHDWAYVGNEEHGIALVQHDSHLLEFGKIHADKAIIESRPHKSHMYSYLFNDWLYANAHETGGSYMDMNFRYSIVSKKGPFNSAETAEFSEQVIYPMDVVSVLGPQEGKYNDATHSFFSVDKPNVQLLTLKLSEEPGRGVVARFLETAGTKCEFGFHMDLLDYDLATETSVTEEDVKELTEASASINPYSFKTIRFESTEDLSLLPPVITARHVSENSARLVWNPVEGATQYNIYRASYSGFPDNEYHLLATTTDNFFCDSLLRSDHAYYYRIAGLSRKLREGGLSDEIKVYTLSDGEAPPAKVGSFYTGLIDKPRAWRADSAHTLYLQWGQNQDTDLSHYELYRGTQPDFVVDKRSFVDKILPGPYVVVPFEDSGLKPHTKYYYRVCAVDEDGNRGELSDVFEGITREVQTSHD